jgi:SAM-dependent methyltransferase
MYEPLTIEGFRCYAPALAFGADNYPSEIYSRLCRLEERHFWFRARNRIILRVFRQYLAHRQRPRILEVGCGTGFVLQGLAAEKCYELIGADSHIAALRHARDRLPGIELVQLDAQNLPYESEIDAIGAFDVIEHIAEDESALAGFCRALRPSGIVVVTVPQHQWLWSSVDEQAGHKRRYARQDLLAKITAAGFDILHVTSFVMTLLPVLYAMRLAKRPRDTSVSDIDWSELEIPLVANSVCSAAMLIDEALMIGGLSLPAGGSLLAIGRKRAP